MKRVVCGFLMLCLTGCATSKLPKQITEVNHYPQCYASIDELRKSDSKVAQSTAVGAVGGALFGALVGGLTSGTAKGALIGGASGALAGGSIGYAKAKQDNYKTAKSRYASYVSDIKFEINNLDQVALAARAARGCYEQQFNMLVREFKAKRISRDEFTARYQEIKTGLYEVSTILGDLYNSSMDKEQQFTAALQDESKKVGMATPPPPKKKTVAASKPSKGKDKRNTAKTESAALPGLDADTLDQVSVTTVEQAQAGTTSLAGLSEDTLEGFSTGTNIYQSKKKSIIEERNSLDATAQQMDSIYIASLSSNVI